MWRHATLAIAAAALMGASTAAVAAPTRTAQVVFDKTTKHPAKNFPSGTYNPKEKKFPSDTYDKNGKKRFPTTTYDRNGKKKRFPSSTYSRKHEVSHRFPDEEWNKKKPKDMKAKPGRRHNFPDDQWSKSKHPQ